MELFAQSSLPRHIRVSGCMQWCPNLCFLATAEGMAVIVFTLPPKKLLSVEMKCDSIALSTNIVEPEGLNRARLITEIRHSTPKVQRMKLDKVLCPSLRSMGDELAIKHARWETLAPTVYPRLAILTQRLLLYTHIDSEWQQTLDITHLITQYVKEHPMNNDTEDKKEAFPIHCRHVRLFTWTQNFYSNSRQHSYIITVNSYGHFIAVRLDDSTEPQVQLLLLPNIATTDVQSIEWVAVDNDDGYLAIGCMDGTCTVVGLTSQLEVTSSKELKLQVDYCSVQLFSHSLVNELLFAKHNQLHIYNMKNDVLQSFPITDTKFSLHHATATDSYAYVATADAGIIVKNRNTGETTQTLSELPQWTSHGVSLSPGGLFLLTVSEPIVCDTYVYQRPVVLKLYKLKQLDGYLKELWNSGDIKWDSFLMIAQHISSLPDWIEQVMESSESWLSLDVAQLRVLYVIYHCLVDKRHHTAAEVLPTRITLYAKLKLLLSVKHMKKTTPTNTDSTTYVSKCDEISAAEPSDREVPHVANRQCPVCEEELRLMMGSCQYQCSNGHSASLCSNTLLPIMDTLLARCILCSAPSSSEEDVPEHLRCFMDKTCAYCGGRLDTNCLL